MTDVTLAAWLLERIAEDEAAARAATPGPWRWTDAPRQLLGGTKFHFGLWSAAGQDVVLQDKTNYERLEHGNASHIARHDPARVLAECEAKRRIVAYADTMTQLDRDPSRTRTGDAWVMLTALAMPFADHPDFDESWRV